MNTTSIRPKKEEDGDKTKSMSTKAPLTERIMKKAAVAVIATACALAPVSCLLDSSGTRSGTPTDAGHDADVELDADHDTDSDVADADTTDGDVLDGDVLDADVADSDITDADVSDADVLDGDVDDGGITDADVSDGDLADGDVEEDAGPTACPGVSNGSIVSEDIDLGDSVTVGGYSLTYVGQVAGTDDIYIDVRCAATGEEVEMGVVVPLYGSETASAPLDGKNIEITNHSSSGTRTRISATVSDS
ncbi:MAG: hypothetical protein ABH983_04005 [Candidatus Micrarchaeota archaeon]